MDKELERYVTLLNDRDPNYSDEVAWELAKSDAPEVVQALVGFLRQPSSSKEDSLVDSVAEALAEVWNRNKAWDRETFFSLSEKAQFFLKDYAEEPRPEWLPL